MVVRPAAWWLIVLVTATLCASPATAARFKPTCDVDVYLAFSAAMMMETYPDMKERDVFVSMVEFHQTLAADDKEHPFTSDDRIRIALAVHYAFQNPKAKPEDVSRHYGEQCQRGR